MAGNTYGDIFRIHTFGESHGMGIGLIIDGCPPGLSLDLDFIQNEMDRRRPGQSRVTTQRKEPDSFVIQSGVFEGKTTGTPISIFIKNKDQKSKDYSHIANAFRPSHADMTYTKKYGIRDYRGGGRSSARETAARVAAGAIAKLLLKKHGIVINAGVTQVGNIKVDQQIEHLDFKNVEDNIIRCPDMDKASQMESLIMEIKKKGETIGGIISCIIKNVPAGLGEPVFDKLHAELGKAMLSINAVKGFEYGSGFSSVEQLGSQHNDIWEEKDGVLSTSTNNSGGIQGGISNGMPIYFNVAFKPVATIMRDQKSVTKDGNETTVKGKGRHDPCVVPRAVPIVEAMAALVIVDFLLKQNTLSL